MENFSGSGNCWSSDSEEEKIVNRDLEDGYYWVRFRGDDEWTIGEHKGTYDSGSPNKYPWVVVGSDEIYMEKSIEEVGERIKKK